MTHLLLNRLDEQHFYTNWGGNYKEVSPYLQSAFAQIIRELQKKIHSSFAEDIAEVVKQLCNPDPDLRGNPKKIRYGGSQHSLERYVSIFGRLAREAEWSLTHKDSIRRSN